MNMRLRIRQHVSEFIDLIYLYSRAKRNQLRLAENNCILYEKRIMQG